MQNTTIKGTWLPLGLSVVALLVLNLGLYTRLASQQVVTTRFDFPYYEDFSSITDMPYQQFSGDWDIRDEALIQLSTSGFDLANFIAVEIPPEQNYTYTTTMRYVGGSMGGGILFNAQQTTSRQQSHMARFNVDAGQLWVIYGYFGDDSNFTGQGSTPLQVPVDDTTPHTLRVDVAGGTYSLYVDDALIAADVPLQYQGGAVGLVSSTSQVAFDDVTVEELTTQVVSNPEQPQPESVQPEQTDPVEEVVVDTTFGEPLIVDGFDITGVAGESLWLPISGNWAVVEGAFVQQQAEGFDLSAIYQVPVAYPLRVQVNIAHQQNIGGGLLFNLPSDSGLAGGHMVRFFEDAVAWGYFDEQGNFNGQGSAPNTQTDGTLAIVADGTTYAVYNGETILGEAIPINAPTTPVYVGLTTSQSVVGFDEFAVFSGESNDPPAEVQQTANIEGANGEWITEDGITIQQAMENTDYIAGTGLAGERFTVSVDITLPTDNPDVGAGIVFHMAGRDDRSSGHMVRLGSAGQELLWGRYDPEGNFIGEGGIPLDLTVDEPHTMRLIVRTGQFDIEINNETVVADIPLQQGSGWIGLVSFSGPVTFTNVNVQLGSES